LPQSNKQTNEPKSNLKGKIMISYIEGILKDKQEGQIVVLTGGIGYEIFVSNSTLASLPHVGEQVELFTFLHVKENALTLYGFTSQEEKSLFFKLIDVSDVGPKKAMGILSGMNYSDLVVAIASQDTKSLSRIKGLGTKTAERICLELKDKVNVIGAVIHQEDFSASTAANQAIETLVGLGLAKNQASDLVKSVAKPDSTVEEILTQAFLHMGR
jgi:Holliday junction DNA helicase RuvA